MNRAAESKATGRYVLTLLRPISLDNGSPRIHGNNGTRRRGGHAKPMLEMLYRLSEKSSSADAGND